MTKRYEDILLQIEQLQAEAEQLRKQEIKSAIEEVKSIVAKYRLSAEDLGFEVGTNADKKTVAKRSTAEPKYRQPETGATWSGRGKPPKWLTNAITAGKKKEEFLIKKINPV